MKMHFALVASAALLGACASQDPIVREGPQAANPITGLIGYRPGIIPAPPPAPNRCDGDIPSICAEPAPLPELTTPQARPKAPAGNEYNRNADIYRAGFAGALTTALP